MESDLFAKVCNPANRSFKIWSWRASVPEWGCSRSPRSQAVTGARRPLKLQNVKPEKRNQLYELLPFFHPPSDFRRGALDHRFPDGTDRNVAAAHQRVSGSGAADHCGAGDLSRRESKDDCRNCRRTVGAGYQWRRELALHVLAIHARRRDGANDYVQARHRCGQGAGARPEPRDPGVAEVARGSAAARRYDDKAIARSYNGRPSHVAG